jgi:Putative Actinobacterial Holin-X, holin superfamily III
MAIVQALLALVSRSLGRILSALFGWAVVALFGHTSAREKVWLSVLVGAAAAWPILLLGVAFPRIATAVLAFVPLPGSVPDWAIRLVWIVLAVSVPFALGMAVAMRSREAAAPIPGARPAAPASPAAESRFIRLLRGIPITLAVAASFFIVFITVPAQRIVSILRRRVDVHVPLVTNAQAYRVVAEDIERTLDRHRMAVDAAEPPWWLTAPSRILLRLGGPSFRDYVPQRLAYFRGSRLDVVLYPNGLLLRGPEQDTAWAHGVLVEALSDAPAYQTFDPGAQDVERQIRSVWQVFRQNPSAHEASAWLEGRLVEIGRDIRELPVPYDEWQIVYRQALQLGRALRGERQLLEEAGRSNGRGSDIPREEAEMITGRANDDAVRAQALSTRELIGEITAKASLLARKEIELAKTEIKADLRSQLAMAKSLAIAAVAALLGVNLLLVSLVAALSSYVAPWLGALLLGGALLVAAGILGYVAWSRGLAVPLALTRKTLKEDVQWAKERMA